VDFDVVSYDPGKHAEFLYSEVRRASSKFPYATPGNTEVITGRWLVERVRRVTVGNPRGCVVAVDPEDHDIALAVLISGGYQQIMWCYTKYPVRRRRIASELCRRVGIDLSVPTYVGVWTMAASRILASGYRLVPEIVENR
jgi:hypothetical protein